MNSWKGHVIAGPDDQQRLEQDHGHRMTLGMSDDMARLGAYSDYKTQTHNEAAAHHLRSAQATANAGQREAADRHRVLYKLHVRAAGHKEGTGVPPAVQAHLHTSTPTGSDYFTAHRADGLLNH